jgi:hypothetical protein
MKDFYKGLSVQISSILISAILAGLLAFIQSLIAQHAGVSPIENPVEQGALLGGSIKTAHSSFLAFRGMMRT